MNRKKQPERINTVQAFFLGFVTVFILLLIAMASNIPEQITFTSFG